MIQFRSTNRVTRLDVVRTRPMNNIHASVDKGVREIPDQCFRLLFVIFMTIVTATDNIKDFTLVILCIF